MVPNPTPIALNLATPARGRRGKPPRHFADLDAEGRSRAVVELGQPAYRARQIGTTSRT